MTLKKQYREATQVAKILINNFAEPNYLAKFANCFKPKVGSFRTHQSVFTELVVSLRLQIDATKATIKE